MTGQVAVAAVDLGASGGRVMAGQVGHSDIMLHEVHRFPNLPVSAGGTLYWDILRLFADVRHGLAAAARRFPLAGAGIDSWGVDYGLLDASGALLGNPVHYRLDDIADGEAISKRGVHPAHAMASRAARTMGWTPICRAMAWCQPA